MANPLIDAAGPPRDLSAAERLVHQAILDGLPAERDRLAECLRVLDYYNLDGAKHVVRNDGDLGHDRLPLETSGLTRRCVGTLCARLYSPPPERRILDDEPASEFLAGAYRDNLVNGLMAEADRKATLLGYAAVEAVPTGEPLKPIRLYLWDASQLVLVPDADDATAVAGVITIDRFDETTRLSWWTADFKRVYQTRKAWTGILTAGGRTAAYRPDQSHANPYGRIPFGLIHHALPTASHRVPGIGPFLADCDAAIDAKRYALALGMKKHFLPRPYVAGMDAAWQPTDTAGEFLRIPASVLSASGESSKPEIGFLQAAFDVQAGEFHVDRSISRALEAVGVPESVYRMSQSHVASGDALEAEQRPLADYAAARRELFKLWETDVAEATLAVGAALSGDEGLRSAARGSNVSVTWPIDYAAAVRGDQLARDKEAVALGVESLATIVARRLNLASPREAIDYLVRVKSETDELIRLGVIPAQTTEATDGRQPE